jgi:nickel-dependent lactate racemase
LDSPSIRDSLNQPALVIELPYGATPYAIDLGARATRVVRATTLPTPPPLGQLLEAALDAPIGCAWPAVRARDRVTLIVSDATRDEPRGAFVAALRRRLPDVRLTIAVATGTHGPCSIEGLGIAAELLRDTTLVNHDGHCDDQLVDLGHTAHGTPVRVHRCAIEADLVIATGCIRPHYFAGFGAGIKAIFPGLGAAAGIRFNHRLKQARHARAGIVDGNPCRADLEEAVALVTTPKFLLDGVCGPEGGVHAVIAGDPSAAFRVGVELARPWFTVRAQPASLVIASDRRPVTASLYQAAKIAAASAPLVEPGGTLVIAAECGDGTGPLEVVNEAIFRIGVLPRLERDVKLVLVSSLAKEVVERTLLDWAPSIEAAIAGYSGSVLVLPEASQLICESTS